MAGKVASAVAALEAGLKQILDALDNEAPDKVSTGWAECTQAYNDLVAAERQWIQNGKKVKFWKSVKAKEASIADSKLAYRDVKGAVEEYLKLAG
jgi:hypothetical protein